MGSGTSSTTGSWWYACSRTAFIGLPPLIRRSGSGAAACRGRCRCWRPGWCGSTGPCAGAAAPRPTRSAHRSAGRRAGARRRRRAGRPPPAGGAAGPAPVTAGTSPSVMRARSAAVIPASASGRHTWSVPAITALRRKSARRASSSSTASPSNERTNPARAATPSLMASAAKWSSSTTSVRRTPSRVDTASYASATMRYAKLGAQKYVGSRRCTDASPSSETDAEATKPSVVIGSSSSGSRTSPRASRRVRDPTTLVMPAWPRGTPTTRRPRRPGPPVFPRPRRAGTPSAPRCRRASPR